jgi:hypothetical protein
MLKTHAFTLIHNFDGVFHKDLNTQFGDYSHEYKPNYLTSKSMVFQISTLLLLLLLLKLIT